MWSIHLCLGTEEYDCRHLQKLSLQAGRFDTNATIFYTMHRRKKVYYVYETRVRAWVIKYKHVVGRRYFSQLFAETTGRMLSCRCMNFRRFRICENASDTYLVSAAAAQGRSGVRGRSDLPVHYPRIRIFRKSGCSRSSGPLHQQVEWKHGAQKTYHRRSVDWTVFRYFKNVGEKRDNDFKVHQRCQGIPELAWGRRHVR